MSQLKIEYFMFSFRKDRLSDPSCLHLARSRQRRVFASRSVKLECFRGAEASSASMWLRVWSLCFRGIVPRKPMARVPKVFDRTSSRYLLHYASIRTNHYWRMSRPISGWSTVKQSHDALTWDKHLWPWPDNLSPEPYRCIEISLTPPLCDPLRMLGWRGKEKPLNMRQ